jgi:alanyl-tRNA synthetase
MTSQQIRETFLEYFARRGHKVVKSSSLLPKDDPTILFTNAGMNQFKNVFLGLETRSYARAASVQKCLRVSGKHNDLETVGRTAKHHTFFEMLGNFSFGDYFKKEAIAFAWELMTGVFGLDPARLYATIYEEDDEAGRIWAGDINIPPVRIFRYGKRDNYWSMGETGPCGPCSELHWDLGEDIERGDPRALIEKGSDRFVELWNLVFMEKNQDGKGGLTPLPSPSIDTGMGLERMAAVLQGKRSNYDTDLFLPLIETVCESAGRDYPAGDAGDVSVRVIADHVRAVTFLVGDGVSPANDGRGYVLRRLIRRAYRHGNLIGIDRPFLYKLAGTVGDIMKEAYPELLASMTYISRVCLAEEERFASTLASGLRIFDQFAAETRMAGRTTISGGLAFKLYDTFGFPLDLSEELAAERGLAVDGEGFTRELEIQKDRARLSWKGEIKQKAKMAYEELKDLSVRSEAHETAEIPEAEVLAVLKNGKRAAGLGPGEEGEVVLDRTPIYAEAGGQVGDTGVLTNGRFSGLIANAYYLTPEIIAHRVKALAGNLAPGDRIDVRADLDRRRAVSGNHTATHLLHAALRQVLGDHVKQAGSLVSDRRLRFDFAHFAAMRPEELRKVEDLVNEKIREDLEVTTRITSLEEGIREGAMAIFEEKYGETVRLVRVGDFSKELCGGIHVHASGEIGLFKILSESSVAAGMRRIEAVTGEEAFRHVREIEDLMTGVEQGLGVPRREAAARIDKLRAALEEAEKENRALRRKLAREQFGEAADGVRNVKGIPILVRRAEGLDMTELRDLSDSLRQQLGSGVVILGSAQGGKAFLVVSVSKDLTPRLQAGAIIRELAPLVGGGGGGRPDFAQAGGSNPAALDEALAGSPGIVEKLARDQA